MWGGPDKGHRTNILSPSGRILGASLVTQTVKNLPSMQDTQVGSLGREDTVEKGIAAYSNTLA